MTLDALKSWLEERGIDEVEGIIPDMAGSARGKIVPARKFCREEGMRLPETLFAQTVTGEYPEEDILHEAENDMLLRPDVATVRQVPWATDPTALVIHDCYHHDGSPVTVAPRYILKQVLDLYEARGWRPVVAPEVEFFLVQANTDADYPLKPPVGRSGRPETVRQSYSIDAVNEFDPLFEQMYDYCEVQEIEIDTLIHESGAAQMEVNFLHTDPLSAADQVFLFKRTVREVALRHSIYATFMAKPMANEPGSAMHLHGSVVDAKTGRNLFANEDGSDSDLFLSHIAGLQEYVPSAMPIFAPYVNSYRRIVRHDAAPINLHWGYDNRTVGLRVPISGAENRRVENRVIGADVNPYLAMAASLACGYLGMVEGLKPTEAMRGSAYDDAVTLPPGLRQALDLLSASSALREVLGDLFVDLYVALKEREYDTFFQVISPWEREFLLLNV
ncbi:MAG: glutamine synthetase family protein [Pseudomonadota bacterium]